MKVSGKTIISRVCEAVRDSRVANKLVVVWAEKFPQYNENDVLSRFRHVVLEYMPDIVIRITSDCPLLTPEDLQQAMQMFLLQNTDYYSNHSDGHDVQIFKPEILWTKGMCHREHVINDLSTVSTGLSVNTAEDLERVRKLCETR